MDVRCEKCQTEYELDEARLKPGGVTVKCTNCGHMFKIRKRSNTNVGAPAVTAEPARAKPPSKPASAQAAQPQQTAAMGPNFARADSMLEEAPTNPGEEAPTNVERQWLIRLENGEQKSCKELATLQQWIVANVVSRESLISRTGKTWKRLGDIAELAQYFDVGDEARTTAQTRKAPPSSKPPAPSTMLGMGATAAGGTILPDDDDEKKTVPARKLTPTPPPPIPRAAMTPAVGTPQVPKRRPTTQPPPPPPKKTSHSGPLPEPPKPGIPAPEGGRATAAWANDAIKPNAGNRQSAPFVGKVGAITDEPAFAGRVRSGPSERAFDTDRVRLPVDDDDAVLPRRKGSSAAVWILFAVLVLGAGATALVYVFVFRKPEKVAAAPADAAVVAQIDAAPVVTPIDAAPVPQSPLEVARTELAHDNEARLQTAYDGLAGKSEPDELTLRALLGAALAQAMLDRAGLVADKTEAEKLRKQVKALATDNVTSAQKAQKAAPAEPGPNLALAHVLRLQGKPAKEIRRYLDTAKAKPGDWARDIALAEALLLAREGKLDDAKAAFAAIDSGEGKLETSNDVRARFHLALVAHAQNRPNDAKPLVDQVLVAQPDHLAAKALAGKLETLVTKTDPLPPEDPKPGTGSGSGSAAGSGSAVAVGPGSGKTEPPPPDKGDYDSYVKRGNDIADTNCNKASDYYAKALEIKPNGVEALTGQGYCALDAKNFATAHRKFSTALATSPRYEPALAGVAETYQRQGRKEDAITAWRRYLELFPGAKKAQRALEVLGAGSGGTTPPPQGSGAGSGSDTTQPPPPPPPPPPPAGSGSG